MALMFAVVYQDHQTAQQAMAMAEALEAAEYARIFDKVLITKDEHGKVDLGEKKHPVRRGVVVGGVLGGMLGLMFLSPVAGAAAGAAVGGVIGRENKSGADDFKSFSEKIEQEIPNGGAAIVLFGDTDARDRVIHDLGSYGGKVHSLDVSDEALAALQHEFDRAAQ
jgi:uncharacterized membrane protein